MRDVDRTDGTDPERLAALDAFLAEYEAAHGEITAEEMDAAAQRARMSAEELSSRFHGLPPVDPQRLREDIDATVDQRLPGVAPAKGTR